jgi:uncharacterized protein YaeQ
MALGSTVRTFEIELADMDRQVYETLSMRVAQHPSESTAYLATRVLAYVLEYREGIAFSGGLANTNEPAVWVRDLTGRLLASVEIGTPDASRLHKASKAADEVAVYCHKDPSAWLRGLAGQKVHQAGRIALYTMDPLVIEALGEGLDRRNTWSVTRTEGTLYLETGAGSVELVVERVPWP